MKMPLLTGLLLMVLGVPSLFVPIPRSETEGIKIGDANFGVQTTRSARVSPVVRAVPIAAGIALAIAGARSQTAGK